MSISILGVVGSLRQNSLNRALLRELAGVMPDESVLSIYEGEGQGIGDLPLFNTDVREQPAAVATFVAAVAAADAVIFSTPEYNFSVPGCLKNAIDWLSRERGAPLKHKPIGIVGSSAGMSGSLRAQLHLRQIMVYFDAPTMQQPEVLVTRAHEKFDERGALADIATRDHLRLFGGTFTKFVQRHTVAVGAGL